MIFIRNPNDTHSQQYKILINFYQKVTQNCLFFDIFNVLLFYIKMNNQQFDLFIILCQCSFSKQLLKSYLKNRKSAKVDMKNEQ